LYLGFAGLSADQPGPGTSDGGPGGIRNRAMAFGFNRAAFMPIRRAAPPIDQSAVGLEVKLDPIDRPADAEGLYLGLVAFGSPPRTTRPS